MRRYLGPLVILILCALIGDWGARPQSSRPDMRKLSPMVDFTNTPWRKVSCANIGYIPVEVSDPKKIEQLVHLLAEPKDEWWKGDMNSDLAFATMVFESSESQEIEFMLSTSTLYCRSSGSVMMRRPLSRLDRDKLFRFFRAPNFAGPTILDVDHFNTLLELHRPLSLTPHSNRETCSLSERPIRFPNRRSNKGIETPLDFLGHNLSVDAVWIKGSCAARVRYSGDNAFCHLGIQSGDLILSVDGVPVWSGSRLACDRLEAPEATMVCFQVERDQKILDLRVPISPRSQLPVGGW